MDVGPPPGRVGLSGRRAERAELDRLLEGARERRSGVLVLLGEAGIGKTALLEYAVASASDLTLLRAMGVESEMELAYAALHQLLVPMLDGLERLLGLQRDALAVAFGLRVGEAPDRFQVGLGVLGLLSEVAEERPVLCVIDDAQWLDRASAQALAFVARRLLAEGVVMLFAAREPGEEFAGLPELVVEGLADADALELLRAAARGPLDERVAGQLVEETRGNPLALLELPRGLSPAQLAAGFGLLGAGSLSGRIEESYLKRLEALPQDTRRILVVAAAEPTGDPGVLWRAGERLGITATSLEPAESAGLLEVGARVRFRHPLVRSAVYRAAAPAERRQVHLALAEATDARADPDRRAWHLAEATAGPDEDVAAELERSAARAQARGGFAAAAAFLERAVALSPERARRARRALAAAQAKFQAGALDDALELLETAESNAGVEGPLGAHAHLLRGQIAFAARRGSDAPPLLLAAARELEAIDPRLARATYLEALSASIFAGRLATPGARTLEVAEAARAAPQPLHPPRVPDLLLDGFVTLFTTGYVPAVPILRQAQRGFGADMPAAEQLRWLWLASISSVLLWDDVRWATLAERHVGLARETGALAELPLALSMRVYTRLFAGELTPAASLVDEIRSATDATGSTLAPYGAVGLAALRGCEAEATSLIEASRADVTRRGEGIGIAIVDWAEAVLHNGLGHHQEAYAAAVRVTEHPSDLRSSNWWMVELIEAAVRVGTPERAAETHRRLLEMTQASGTDWALGLEARSSALLAEGQRAEDLYAKAIDHLGRGRIAVDLARAHLLYGEWLRSESRGLDAREQLRTAREMFTRMGTEAFAARAERELSATGERVRTRSLEARAELSAQEAQIARLARDGHSNREIATRLFISPHTVHYHLRKVFVKLNITSRNQLGRVLSDSAGGE
jgi:DNA-binding CsgD family transcriptional regulator